MANPENVQKIVLRNAKLYANGLHVGDAESARIWITPIVSTFRESGDPDGENTNWLGYTAKGEMVRIRASKFLRDQVTVWKSKGITPSFTMQGIQVVKGSDYAASGGKDDTVTATGCVVTSDINLFWLDVNGEVLKDTIQFNVKNVTIK
ncbi:MAG: hypothetical protein LBT21_06280 [Oscillospiraceae bacterium]|jgi:hypothetical protein|nr:hypothetical protein [Oscillospiraceae bacterium]